MKTLIAMALMVTSVAVMGDEVKEVKVEEPKAEVVTVPVEAIPSLTAEQIKEILKRDEERAKWLAERVKKEQEAAKEQEEKKADPVISKVYTFNYNPMFMRNNKITATLEVGDQAVVKLTGDRRVMKWSVGKDENAVMDLLMTYHNEDGVKPRVETIDFDIDEDEAEIVEKREDGTINRRPYMPIVTPPRPNTLIQSRNRGMGGFAGGFEGPFPNQPGMMGIGQNMSRPTVQPPMPRNEIYVFQFQAMEKGTEKIIFSSTGNQTFEITFNVK